MDTWKYIQDYDSIPFDIYLILRKKVYFSSYPFSSALIVKRRNTPGTFEQEHFIVHGIKEQAIYDFYMSGISGDKLSEILKSGQFRQIPRDTFEGYYILNVRDCGLLLNYTWMSDEFKHDLFGR